MLDQPHRFKIQGLIECWKKNEKERKILFNVRNDFWNFFFSLKLVQESIPMVAEEKDYEEYLIIGCPVETKRES